MRLDIEGNLDTKNKYKERLSSIRKIIPLSSLRYHTLSKKKKEQLDEGNLFNIIEKWTEIERANRILLEKVTKIIREKRPIDTPIRKKSLNITQRRNEQKRINIENKVIA